MVQEEKVRGTVGLMSTVIVKVYLKAWGFFLLLRTANKKEEWEDGQMRQDVYSYFLLGKDTDKKYLPFESSFIVHGW